MRCRQVRWYLQVGEAPSENARARIEAHLHACEACRDYAAEMERLRATLAAFARLDAAVFDPALRRRVGAGLPEGDPRPRGLRAWFRELEAEPFPALLQAGLALWVVLAGSLRFPLVEPTLRWLLGF